MPTKRRRRERFRRPDIDPYHWALLTDAPIPEDANSFSQFSYKPFDLWPKFRERILTDWIASMPGTRPEAWWLVDAPRLRKLGKFEGCYSARYMIEPRLLLEGDGRPAWEVLAIAPSYHLGIPQRWTSGDPDALVFEPQYDYLKRHGLLEPGEGQSYEPGYAPGGHFSQPNKSTGNLLPFSR